MKNLNATIMIPAYNVENFIGESLQSAINQTYKKDYEILVVNDGSTDDTKGIIEWYQKRNPNIRLINQENSGTSKARNKLLSKSNGEILFGLDADDILNSEALEKVISCFNKNPNINHVYTNQSEIDEKGKELRTRKRENIHPFSDELIYHCHFQGHLKSFRKTAIGKNKFNENLKSAVDWDFFLQLYPILNIKHLPEILYDYRMNEKGISFSKRGEVIQNSIDLVTQYVKQRKLYGNKEFEVVPINAGKNIHYYDHIIAGKSTMNPKARNILERYLQKGY